MKVKYPSVTIIIPVLNGESIIGKCLRAIEKQTYKGKIQTVVINDGSTDNTSQVVQQFSGVKLIEQENRGRAAARNRGISESTGDIIVFTDSDCIPDTHWLEKLIERLLEKENRGVISGSITIPEDANLWQLIDHQAWAHSTGPEDPAGPTLFGSTANMCIFRQVFNQVDGFDNKLLGSEDSDLTLRVHKAGYENFFDPSAMIEHHHPRTSMVSFMKQRYNYGKWTIQTVLKHKPLTQYSWIFPKNRILLTLFWPAYAIMATMFTIKRLFPKDRSVLFFAPIHFAGRLAEYMGTIKGCGEYLEKYERGSN